MTLEVRRGGSRFLLSPHASSSTALAAFQGGEEAATLAFFDATLPACRRMFDFGAYVGLMSLYAATQVAAVHAVEASPSHQALLAANLALNPALAQRITLHPVAVGARDATACLFRKADSDSGTSLFEVVEREGVVRGRADIAVPVRAAGPLLEEAGLDGDSLVKIDVEGAEYDILPAIADLLARHHPFLQVSFHPFNLVGPDPYRTTLRRLRAAIDAAEALASYRFVYLHDAAGIWRAVGPADRPGFLRDYLLRAKQMPRIGSAQFGFIGAVGFSPIRLDALHG